MTTRVAARTEARRGPTLPSGIVETCLYVADLTRSQQFYSDLLEYPLMKEDARFCAFDAGEGHVLLLFLRGSDPEGSQLPFGFIPPHAAHGQAHLGFAVPADSLAAWEARLADRKIVVESRFQWPTGGISVYFRDPDGHLLELLTPGVWSNY